MALKDTIKNDLKEAMKSKNELALSVIRMLTAAISSEEINKGKREAGLNDEEVLEVLSREIKRRKDSATQFEGAGRAELAEKENQEVGIIMKYMPAQMTAEEIEKVVKESIAESGAKDEKDFGTVMKILSPKIKGRADGKQVSEVVKKMLADCQC